MNDLRRIWCDPEDPMDIRRLENSKFIKEPIRTFKTVMEKDFQLLIDFKKERDMYSIAPNGGAMVVAHDRSKRTAKGKEFKYYSALHIYDSKCNLMTTFPITHQKRMKNLYMTPEENIIIVYDDARVETYNQRGMLLAFNDTYGDFPISMQFCCIWPTGLMIVTVTNDIFIYENFVTLTPRLWSRYIGPNLMNGVVVPGNYEKNTGHQLWCTTYSENGKKELALIQENDYEHGALADSVEQVIFSPDYSIALAICSEKQDGLMVPCIYYFCSPDFSKIYIATKFTEFIPDDVYWCGSDSILLIKGTTMAMIGVSSDALKWELESPPAVCSEVDGARIFTSMGSFLLRSITENVYQIAIWNIRSPQVRLLSAMLDERGLAEHDIKVLPDLPNLPNAHTDDYTFRVSEVKEALSSIDEAARFFTKYEQRKLLMKAATRMISSVHMEKDDGFFTPQMLDRLRDYYGFAEKLANLRAIEQLARSPYNMPMTYAQFANINSTVLLKRICNRSLHIHAFKMAQYIGIDAQYIATHWAMCLVTTSVDASEIISRLRALGQPIDFIDIARMAFRVGRTDLAMQLIDQNPAKGRAVPLLVERGQWRQALESAITSNDTSVIIYAFEAARDAERFDEIEAALSDSSVARSAWLKATTNEERRVQLLKWEGRGKYAEAADLIAKGFGNEFAARAKKIVTLGGDAFFTAAVSMIGKLAEVKRMVLKYRQVNEAQVEAMTPYELFDQIILMNNRKKLLEAADEIFDGSYVDEILWRRLICGLKYDSVSVLKSFMHAMRKSGVPPYFMEYAERHGTERAVRILKGEEVPDDPDDPSILGAKEVTKKERKSWRKKKDSTPEDAKEAGEEKADAKEEKAEKEDAKEAADEASPAEETAPPPAEEAPMAD